MNAVRYYSRTGNTKKVAEVMAEALKVEAISTDSPDAAITDKVDTLFIGGGLYAYGIDKNLAAYIDNLDADMVKRAVVFSTSWLSKHAIDIIRKSLQAKGITVDEKTCYLKSKEVNGNLSRVREFAAKYAFESDRL